MSSWPRPQRRTTHSTSSRQIVFTNIYTGTICTVRQILVARTLLLVRRHREEQLLDTAIIPVAGSFLSSSAAVACWITNGELTQRFGINLSNQEDLFDTLRRVRAADHVQETWWTAIRQNAMFVVPYRPSE